MKIIDSIWFSSFTHPTIGIVFGQDEITGERKAYIGIGGGVDEARDDEHIAKTGAPFRAEVARIILERLGHESKR